MLFQALCLPADFLARCRCPSQNVLSIVGLFRHNSIEHSSVSTNRRYKRRAMVIAWATRGHSGFRSLFRVRAPLNRRRRNITGHRGGRLASPHNRHSKNRISPNSVGPSRLVVLLMDRFFILLFRRAAHQPGKAPINLRCFPFLLNMCNRHPANGGVAGRGHDPIGRRWNNL